jgi:hypothetical protein
MTGLRSLLHVATDKNLPLGPRAVRGSEFETEIPETKAKLRHQGWVHTRDYLDILNAKPR